MTSLDDAAAGSPEVVLQRDQHGRVFQIVSDDLTPADEVTPSGEFPQYGQFMRCRTPGKAGEEVFVEVSDSLAEELVADLPAGEREGRWFRVVNVRKSAGGAWIVDVETDHGDPLGEEPEHSEVAEYFGVGQ